MLPSFDIFSSVLSTTPSIGIRSLSGSSGGSSTTGTLLSETGPPIFWNTPASFKHSASLSDSFTLFIRSSADKKNPSLRSCKMFSTVFPDTPVDFSPSLILSLSTKQSASDTLISGSRKTRSLQTASYLILLILSGK